jgi:seryl-tRNA synthetase
VYAYSDPAFAFLAKYDFEQLRRQKNDISKLVAQKKKDSKGADKCDEEIAQSKTLDEKMDELTKHRNATEKELEKQLNKIGNIVSPNVPVSKTEDDNRVVRKWGEPGDIKVSGEELGKLHHHEVMQCLDFVELERGARIAGHRGYFLKGYGVLLNQALINFGLKTLVDKGYTPV